MRFVFAPLGYSLSDNERLPKDCYDTEVICETIEDAYLESLEHSIFEWVLLDACSLEYYGTITVS